MVGIAKHAIDGWVNWRLFIMGSMYTGFHMGEDDAGWFNPAGA